MTTAIKAVALWLTIVAVQQGLDSPPVARHLACTDSVEYGCYVQYSPAVKVQIRSK